MFVDESLTTLLKNCTN